MKLVLVILFLSGIFTVKAWDQSDLEMFDLMEESATPSDIKSAYRKLSLSMHPDRNQDDPDAGVKFRQLSVIYQILKDKERRERYDDALKNGIPDWKTPVFYYRKLRKMSNFEIGALVSAFAITIHFATLWGFAFERRWTLRDRLENHMKRHKASEKRKIAIDSEINEQLKAIKWPSFMDILPIALIRGGVNLILSIPAAFAALRGTVHANIEKVAKDFGEKRELSKELEERAKRKELQKKKRMESSNKTGNNEELDYFNNPSFYQVTNLVVKNDELAGNEDAEAEHFVSSKPWNQNEELALIRLTNKYPGGFPNRWTKIAQTLGRSVADVISKASEIATDLSSRTLINPTLDDLHVYTMGDDEQMNGEVHDESDEGDDYYLSKRKAKRIGKADPKKHPSPAEETIESEDLKEVQEENVDKEDDAVHISRRKQKAFAKAKANEAGKEIPAGDWTQKEQNELETAMISFPKGTPRRWQLVAECVPSKTLTEVLDRVKFLAERSKKRAQEDD
ncbi:hypothetical protein Aperf_G00000103461 [Anoplocephala perfoliata]